jgi:predicted transcriptional regulator
MIRTPCEYILWNLLPALRSELARCMVKDLGLSQKEAAEKLEIQPAAVCMYLSDKRGKSNFKNKILLNEIKISAKNIIKDKNKDIITETCRLCKFIKKEGLLPFSDNNKM